MVTLSIVVEEQKYRFFFALFSNGILMHSTYMFIQAGAESLAKDFGKANLMPVIQFSLLICNGLSRTLMAKYFLHTRHVKRYGIACLFMTLSFLTLSICCFFKSHSWLFYVMLVATVVFGAAFGITDSTLTGLLKGFPKQCIGYYYSGIGVGGILGTSLLLGFKALGI
jgi:MFS family permease